MLHLLADDGGRIELPVAIVSDRNPDRTLKVIRVYHSMWPLTGGHRVRERLLPRDPDIVVPNVMGEYQRALAAGDLGGRARYLRGRHLRPRTQRRKVRLSGQGEAA